jgi:hypothetical protein
MPILAQVADYTFLQATGTYTPITGGTSYGIPTSDDQRFVDPAIPLGGTVNTGPGLPLGFTFTYNGTNYDRIGINANGWISFGTAAEGVNMATTSAYTPLASTLAITPAHLRNRISALGRDIIGGFTFAASGTTGSNVLTGASSVAGAAVGATITGTGIPAGTTITATTANTVTLSANLTANATAATYTVQSGSLRLQTIGAPGSRVAVIQWTNYRRFGTNGTNDNLNFQIRLYETTNVVEVQYGFMQFGAAASTGTAAAHVGLGGAVATDFNNRQTTTNWNTSIPGAANTVGMDMSATVVPPTSGLTFRWTPGSCPSPGGITFTALLATSVTANWNSTGATSYTYELRTSGAPGSGPTGLVATGNTATTTVNLTGLAPNTTYTFHVRSLCGGDLSNWATATFTTPCTAVVAPYVETFDNVVVTASAYVTPPSCWNNFSSAGNFTSTTNVWRFANGIGNPSVDPDYGVENVTDHTSGSGFFAWYDGSFGTGVTNITLESPLIDMSGLTAPFVRFFLFSNNTDDGALNPISLQAYDGTTWVNLLTYQGNAPQWIELSATVPAGIPSTTRFRIVAQPGTGGSIFYNDLLVDDFAVINAPTCFPPTAITVGSITTTTATVSFTGSGAPSYGYEVRTSGAPGSGPAGLVSSGTGAGSPITLTGLPSGTNLIVYLQGICPGNDLSAWSQGVAFTTPCTSFTVPWSDNFNTTTPGSTPNCWTIIDLGGATTWGSVVAPTSPAGFTGTTMRYTYSFSDPANDWLISPGLELTGGVSYRLEYRLGHNAGTSYTERVRVMYGTSPTAAAMTNLIHDHDSLTGTTSAEYEWDFTPPTTGVYYIGYYVYSIANQFYVYLDDVSVAPSPICATTTVTQQQDCTNDEFSLLVNVESLGTATSVDVTYTVDYGTPITLTGITSSTTLGPFPEMAIVDVVVNNGFPTCSAVDLGSFHSNCPFEVDCDSTEPVMLDHCYTNNDTRTFTFVASDPGSTLDLKFLQPSPIAPGDGITAWSGLPGVGTQITLPPAGSDLSSLGTIQSSGNTLSISIQSNASGSCDDGATDSPWTIQVRCSGCIEPMGDVVITTDCDDYSFNLMVDLYYLGYSEITESDLTSAGISYTVDGGPATVLTGLTEDLHVLGDFPVGSVVNIILLHDDGAACSNFLGDFTENLPCPPDNDACAAAAPLTVNSPGACPGASISGTTLYSTQSGAMPACATTGTVQDVWYAFNSGFNIMPLTLNLTTGTAHNVGYQVFTACGAPVTGSCAASVTAPVQIPNLTPNTSYLLRVFTRTNLGSAGSFNVCLTGTPAAQLCDGAINIPSVPVNAQPLVCQSSNLLSATSVPAVCGTASNSYKGGNEALYTFTPTVTGSYIISIAGQTWTSIFVYSGACPASGGTCVASIGTSAATKSLTVTMTAGVLYYIWFDTFPSPTSPCPGTFSIIQELCPAPTAVTATGMTTTTANINWTGGAGTYIIEYGPSATFTTPGTGATAGAGGTVVSTTAPPPYTLTGLLGNTQYRVFVRRDCTADGNGFSANSTAVLFTTAPNPPMQPTCNSMWYDSGGPTGDYGNNENYVVTICPPAGQVARVTFSAFNTEANWDRLHIYNGPDITSPMFSSGNTAGSGSSPYGAGGWWGDLSNNLPGPFISSDPSGCLTFAFWSDASGIRAGWAAMIECFELVVPPCLTAPSAPADGSSICAGPTTLSWPASTGATGYDVYFNAGTGAATTLVSTNQTGTTYAAGTLAAGPYTWRVEPRTSAGIASGCPNWSFTVNEVPVVTATNSGPVCAGQSVTLTATAPAGSTFSWQGPGGFTSSEAAPVITNATTANSGSYSVTATLAGCASTPASTSVLVQPAPTNVTATATPTVVCPGEEVDLAATGNATGIALSEGFNSPTNNWTTVNNSSAGTDPALAAWTLRQSPYVYSSTTFSSNDASQFYMSNSDAQGSGGTTLAILRSPSFSLAEFTTASLSFWHYYRYLGTNDTTQVQVSTNGTTWTSVQTYTSTQGAPAGFVQSTINLNAYAGQPTVHIRFRYRATYGWYWAIDNVVVSGQQAPTFAWTSDPAGFTSTEQNPQNVVVNGTTTYTVTASNSLGCSTTASVTVNADATDSDGDGIPDCLDECPELAGEVGDPCDDGNPNTTGDVITSDCQCVGTPTGDCTELLTLEVTTDANGQQTSWEIAAQGTNVVLCDGEGFPNNATVTVNCCVPEGCYVLRVFDSAGDGIANGGYILRTFPDNRRIIDNRQNFTTGSVSAISGDQGFCLPIGDDRLIYTSCDKLDWVSNQFIVASPDPAVSAEWIPGAPNSAQDTDTGYEFWFFDPNGSYSFRRFRNHATSDGFGNVGATRAAHLQLNNWSPANHIPTGVLLNVRVRAVVNGVAQEWGPACRFKLDPVAAACPMTLLMDIPGNQFLSCGQFRYWGTGNFVHARPVSGATQYQFRFRQPAEGYEVVRTTSSYFVQLFWTVPPPLVPGSQYEVDVRAFKNGQWCPWGNVCTLNINLGLQQGMAQQRSFDGGELALQMWPNPNNGDLLHLSINEIPEGVELVHVELFDMFGKRVMARSIAVIEGPFLTLLNLNGDVASGMYTLNLLIGEEVISQRLVIQR